MQRSISLRRALSVLSLSAVISATTCLAQEVTQVPVMGLTQERVRSIFKDHVGEINNALREEGVTFSVDKLNYTRGAPNAVRLEWCYDATVAEKKLDNVASAKVKKTAVDKILSILADDWAVGPNKWESITQVEFDALSANLSASARIFACDGKYHDGKNHDDSVVNGDYSVVNSDSSDCCEYRPRGCLSRLFSLFSCRSSCWSCCSPCYTSPCEVATPWTTCDSAAVASIRVEVDRLIAQALSESTPATNEFKPVTLIPNVALAKTNVPVTLPVLSSLATRTTVLARNDDVKLALGGQ